jgi:hypothetical protein
MNILNPNKEGWRLTSKNNIMTLNDTQKRVISNKSKTYLLPLISKDVSIEFDYLLINTYIKFNRNIDIDYPFGLLYEIENTDAWNEYNDYLTLNPLYHTSHLAGCDKKLFIFRFPEKYFREYTLFKEGKYSQFDTEAKSLIISYSALAYKYPPLIEDLTGVLFRHKSRRIKIEKELGMSIPESCELASRISYDNETFYFNE